MPPQFLLHGHFTRPPSPLLIFPKNTRLCDSVLQGWTLLRTSPRLHARLQYHSNVSHRQHERTFFLYLVKAKHSCSSHLVLLVGILSFNNERRRCKRRDGEMLVPYQAGTNISLSSRQENVGAFPVQRLVFSRVLSLASWTLPLPLSFASFKSHELYQENAVFRILGASLASTCCLC